MTVAQLVQPAHSFARHSQRAVFRTWQQSATQRLSADAAVWRAISIGMGFAAAAFAMMVGALAG